SDPNATTLVSAKGPRLSRPSASRVAVVEADDDPDSESMLDGHPSPGFVAEDQEPPPSIRRFRHEEASLMPVVDDRARDDEEPLEAPGLGARRARLRRVVGSAVGTFAVAGTGLGIKAAMSGPSAPASAPAPVVAPPPGEPAPVAREAIPEPAATPAKETAESSETTQPSDAARLEEARKMTVTLLKDGKPDEAERWARTVIELEPEDAFGYRALGAALQDQGKPREARKAFSDCVTLAKTGNIGESNALGGVKRR